MTFDGTSKRAFARLLSNGSLDSSFVTALGTDGFARSVLVHQDGSIWLGGSFANAGGAPRRNLARIDTNGVADLRFDPFPRASDEVFALVAQPDGRVVAGGHFWSFDDLFRSRVARLLSTNPAVQIRFESNVVSVAEEAGPAQIVVHRLGSQEGTNAVDFTTANGSALAGSDYLAQSGTLVFGRTQNLATISVPLIGDTVPEPSQETFAVSLSNPTGGAILDNPTTMSVIILDNDVGFSVVCATNLPAREEWPSIPFTIQRGNDPLGEVSVGYNAVDGTAHNGSDFQLTAGRVTFAAGETQKTVYVSLLHDAVLEGPETFQFVLTSPSPGTYLSAPTNVVVTIEDQDSLFYFGIINYMWEPNNNSLCYVERRGPMKNVATVRVRTSSGSATALADYFPFDTVFSFAPGENYKYFYINVVNDGLVEGDETVNLTLSEPTGNAVLGSPSNAVITILDNDRGIEFVSSNLFVNERLGKVFVPITRRDDGTNVLTVQVTSVCSVVSRNLIRAAS